LPVIIDSDVAKFWVSGYKIFYLPQAGGAIQPLNITRAGVLKASENN